MSHKKECVQKSSDSREAPHYYTDHHLAEERSIRRVSMRNREADHSVPVVARLSGRNIAVTQMVCITLVLLSLALFVAGLPVVYDEFRTLAIFDNSAFDRSEVRTNLSQIGLSTDFYAGFYVAVGAIYVLTCYATATIIFLRRPTEPIALFAVVTLAVHGATTSGSIDALGMLHPLLGALSSFLGMLGYAFLLMFFYLFPDGRFVPRWTRWAAVISVAYAIAVSLFSGLPFSPGQPLYWPVLLSLLLTGVFAQVYRYWRISSAVKRQQTKWVVFGFAMAVTGTSVTILIARVLSPVQPGTFSDLVATAAQRGLLLLIPLSFAIAILHYRLWDVDIFINRTLVYGALTALLIGLYFGGIVVLQRLFSPIMAGDNGLATVATTLAIAALFNPFRHRIQSFIDRRFYRRKYNARRTLEAFSATLRNETNLEALSDDLVGVVRETMQPAHVSLWLRPDTASRGQGAVGKS
jgi:hypothetical protein